MARYEPRVTDVLEDKTLIDKQLVNTPNESQKKCQRDCPQAESEFLQGKLCDFKKFEIFLQDCG